MSEEEFDQLWTSCDWRQEIDTLRAENKKLRDENTELIATIKDTYQRVVRLDEALKGTPIATSRTD